MGALAPCAVQASNSRGRQIPEAPPAYRSEWQRDRDRIIHSAAFRRLEYKTQVFVNHEGDMFRTRLTHSLEVAQIARTIARALSLNEDLTEAIALAHDLGHTPFGHAGQHALNACMAPFGGFEHNLQSLRVVDELEQRYAAFPGLNLGYETREGILKHCNRRNALALGEVAERFLQGRQPSLEAQVAHLSDDIAYNNHDVDDGLRSGLLVLEQLLEMRLFRRHFDAVRLRYASLPERRVVHEVIRRMINEQVSDLIETTRSALADSGAQSLEEVRAAPGPLVSFTPEMRAGQSELKAFLRTELYDHYRVRRMSMKSARVLRALFELFMDDSGLLPPQTRERIAALDDRAAGESARARAVADYLAGMTDRYALAEYERLYSPGALP